MTAPGAAPPLLPLLLFALTYLGVALGRVPGLALDRTGIALLGAVAFLATGGLTFEQAKAAVDVPTLAVLFGLMLLSAQYQLSGLYGAIGARLARERRPRRLLAATIVTTAALSAVLTNDVVCFALTPLLVGALLAARLEPRPFLLALACAANVGSAATPIGNPQNILIANTLGLRFAPFVAACIVPVALSLVVVHLWLRRDVPTTAPPMAADAAATPIAPVDRAQARKAILLTVAAIALFLTPVPMHLTALLVAGVVLTSRRMATRDMLALVDWHLLALFCGLFVVLHGLAVSGWIEAGAAALARAGGELREVAVLVPVVAVLGNLVGNVPAVMLLLPLLPPRADVGYALALSSTLAGNALLVGSVANLIVAESAARAGVPIRFREHLRVGLPVTLLSLALAAAWLALTR